jgi:hypothetical protein
MMISEIESVGEISCLASVLFFEVYVLASCLCAYALGNVCDFNLINSDRE